MLKCYHIITLSCYHAKVLSIRKLVIYISQLMKPKKLARNFNKSKSRFILKVNGRVLKLGPEFNLGFWCMYCKQKFNCSWVDYYDCLDYNHRSWFGHLDIGVVLE